MNLYGVAIYTSESNNGGACEILGTYDLCQCHGVKKIIVFSRKAVDRFATRRKHEPAAVSGYGDGIEPTIRRSKSGGHEEKSIAEQEGSGKIQRIDSTL